MEVKISVAILSNNRLLRESLARILTKRPDIQVETAQQLSPNDCNEALESRADILLLDSVPFLQAEADRLKALRANDGAMKLVLVAMDEDAHMFMQAVREGALGYILKDASAMDVVAAVRSVAQGEAVCPPRMSKLLFDYVRRHTSDLPNARTRSRLGLTRREQQLIPLIGRGLTNKEIASHLNLSEQTIKNHIHRIIHKVGVDDRLGAVEACQATQMQV